MFEALQFQWIFTNITITYVIIELHASDGPVSVSPSNSNSLIIASIFTLCYYTVIMLPLKVYYDVINL